MTIDVALVGCGHMGAHHARVVSAHPGCRLVAAVDLHPERAERLTARFGGRAVREVPAQVDAVVVATPATSHADVVEPLLGRGAWCLVEKPMATSVDEADRIAADRLVVGHSERFNPAVRALGAVRPTALRAVRRGPSSPRGADVDVVLDRMAHDLDLALWWSGDAEPRVVRARRQPGDTVAATLIAGAMEIELLASRSASAQVRTLDLDGPGGPWAVDLLGATATRAGVSLPPPDGADALEAQWRAFVAAMDGGPTVGADAAAGRAVVALAERIRAALRDTGGA